jgi:hypothetical protein
MCRDFTPASGVRKDDFFAMLNVTSEEYKNYRMTFRLFVSLRVTIPLQLPFGLFGKDCFVRLWRTRNDKVKNPFALLSLSGSVGEPVEGYYEWFYHRPN